MTLTLTPLAESRLRALAAATGQTPEHLIEQLLERERPEVRQGIDADARAPSAMIALFDEWDAEDETQDSEELRRRNQEWAETRASLSANRLTLRDLSQVLQDGEAA